MDKRKTKKPNYHTLIIDRLRKKYGVSRGFITMSLGGDRESETSTSIVKDYSNMETAVKKLLDTL